MLSGRLFVLAGLLVLISCATLTKAQEGEAASDAASATGGEGEGEGASPSEEEAPEQSEEQQAATSYPGGKHCLAGSWQATDACSAECGTGTQTFKLEYEDGSDSDCPVQQRIEPCNEKACVQHCEPGPWYQVGNCSKECDGGKMTWKRDVDADKQALHGGRECGPLEQELDCNTHECGVNATMSEWASCGPCSVSCGSGEQKFCRHEETPKNQYGRPALDTLELRQCFLQNCYAECKIEKDWYPVQTECSKSCGGGTQVFQRVVTGGSKNGPSCPPSQELRSCNPDPCPTDCEYDKWVPDATPCSKSCGGGKRRYTRAYKHGSENNGEPCEHLEKEEDCNMFDCPQDCTVSDWKSDGVCSAHTCGDGTQLFTRSIIVTDQEKQNDWGRPCPYTSEYRVCTLGPCAL